MTTLNPIADAIGDDLHEFRVRLGMLERAEQLSSSTVGTDDDDATPIVDLVVAAIDSASSVPALESLLEDNASAVSVATDIANAAAEAAEAAGELGLQAAADAQEAADDALEKAEVARQNAADAVAAAADAVQAAQEAQTAIADVDERARAADQKAVDAASAASDAQQAALDAAGVAAGKGKVYAQPTAPDPVDLNGLWIDTDDGNKPYRGQDLGTVTVRNASTNPSPEGGTTTGYTPNQYGPQGTIDVSTDRAHTGTKSWRYTTVGGGNGEGFAFAVPAGQRYASVWVYNPSSGGVDHLGITGLVSNGPQIPVVRTTVRDAWAKLSIDFGNTDGGLVVVYVDETPSTAGARFYWDDVMIGSGDYVDGSMPGASWDGAPYASSSTFVTSGPQWVPAQDETIAAAAAAAADAIAAATDAQGAASDALTSANGKTTNRYSPTAPTGQTPGATVGDTWYIRASNTGIVTGVYEWDGDSWEQRTLDNAAIANLDAAKITSGYIAAARIAAGTITGDHIAATTIQAANIAASAITTDKLAANAITAAKIGADVITSREIAADAITAAELAADAVLARNIKAGQITAEKIAANAIAAANIQAGAIGADQIAANAVTAAKIAAGAVTATSIAAGAIDGITITGSTLRTAATSTRIEVRAAELSPYQSGDIAFFPASGTGFTIRPVAGGIGVGVDEGDYGVQAGVLPNSGIGGNIPVGATGQVAQYAGSSTAYSRNLRVGTAAAIPRVFDPATGYILLDDTGWVTLALAAAYTGTRNYAVSRIGQWISFQGQVQRTNGANLTASDTNMFTLPVPYRPRQDLIVNAGGPAGFAPRLTIGANGVVGISALPSGYNASYIILDSIVPYRVN